MSTDEGRVSQSSSVFELVFAVLLPFNDVRAIIPRRPSSSSLAHVSCMQAHESPVIA